MNNKLNTRLSTKAVVLGLGINGLAIARSLGEKGISVYGVYDSDNEFGRLSRYCNAVQFPPLKNGENEFLKDLIEKFGDIKNKPVLFWQSESYVMFVSRFSNELEKYFRFSLPDHELLEILVNKERSTAFVASKGLQIPKTYFFDSTDNIEQKLDRIEYPCLMKPVDSFSTEFEEKTLTFSDKNSLKKFMTKRKELIGNVIIQQIIPGGDANTYQATTYISKNGDISPIFTMRKIRQSPPNFGITSYGISEEIPLIKEKVKKFLSSIPYRGFASIEFKKHPQTDEWFYIELNPRLPYYHSLIFDCGINFPYIYYKDMCGLKLNVTSNFYQNNGVTWINFNCDLFTFFQKYSQQQIYILSWLNSVLKARSYAIFDRKDLKPFLYKSMYYLKILFQKAFRRILHLSSNNNKLQNVIM